MPVVYAGVKSSQIAKVGYDLAAKPDADGKVWNLFVEFATGAVYKYHSVPPEVVMNVVFAESVGSAFGTLVKKGLYPYQMVQGAKS